MIRSLLSSQQASRFYLHWINADPSRAEMVASLAGLSASSLNFAVLLQNETDAGHPLPRAMRRLRNLLVATLIERDLSGLADLDEVVTAMSAFADFAIRTHQEALMAEMVGLHGMPVGEGSGEPQELIVLGMGKLGGGELNVSSDIDLIFAYGEDGETQADTGQRQLSNHEFFIRLGRRLISALSEIVEDGFVFRVDMALRPNGASGPLVASLAMIEEYLIVQGREWERYAWVKARAVTGRQSDIAELEGIVRPFVFRRYLDFGVIDAIRNMHGQIRAEVARQERIHPERSNNIKLGRGGIREIEFLAQSFQLIRGGRDAALRDRSTRATLRTLVEKELLDADIVQQLLESYTFLRNLEHRIQYLDDAQTHMLPSNDADMLSVAKMMGCADVDALMSQLVAHRRFVAARFEAIFSDKNDLPSDADGAIDLQVLATLPENERREAIAARMTALGFDEPETGTRRLLALWQMPRIQALPEVSSDLLARLCNSALPLIVREGRPHSATLGRLMDFFEAIARRAAYLSLLTEYPETLERVIRMMHASDWAAKFLTRHPILLDELLNDLLLKAIPDWQELARELAAQLVESQGDTERQMDLLREVHHAQQFHLLAYDLQGGLTMERLADHLTALADMIIDVSIQAIWHTIANRHIEKPKFAVIAYGKLGGKELGYASDLDVIFLYDDDHQDAPMLYARLAQRFITWMTSHTSAGILFDVDTALRPDGASGMLVSSVSAFENYQRNAAWVWEHQALTRARFCAGDAAIGARFEAIREQVLRQPHDAGKLKQEVLAMRKKMRDAHPDKTPTLFDLKHGGGGMIDIEFIVQYLVLLHAAQYPQLTGNLGNIALLRICDELGLIPSGLGIAAGDAYRELRRLQHLARLQGDEDARVPVEAVASQAQAARRLWDAVFPR
ncbi:MAG: bifunctional [glutamate--ammonia ligase]-adenylyl-L-tyrosine phosphorylase/[glutamate--ammonia-ligase] adenylyltransferase [Burkholderiaceae bacterium]|nr:bifunctional [glutamate--ammonia ligase]-adenylyl-L-tyrosine phosphorylase/[glutamate--ammonia-ligase] adenylyltransferase [Burkholderiaceae bacterium]